MIHYLLDTFLNNFFIIASFALTLIVFSFWFKKVKHLTISIVAIGFTYLLFLFLYKFGIGIEYLYNFSCKYIIFFCEILNRMTNILLAHQYYLCRLFKIIQSHDINEMLSIVFVTIQLVMLFYILFNNNKRILINNKIAIKSEFVIKEVDFNNNNNVVKPLFLLNDVFRC